MNPTETDQTDQAERVTRSHLPLPVQDRRRFVKTVVVGSLAWSARGLLARGDQTGAAPFSRIVVDFDKCTGCRTCEAVCAAYNHKVTVGGEVLLGLGNPRLSNIRVSHFNPDVDVPSVCVMCGDSPCIEICPVEPDKHGHRALYRDPKTSAIKNDPDRCIKCGACAKVCAAERAGAIVPNPGTNLPERMCTLCDGDPQCVKHCPYGALRWDVGGLDGKNYALPAERIAEGLTERWYGPDARKGGGER